MDGKKEELCVVSIQVLIEGHRWNESTEWVRIHDKE